MIQGLWSRVYFKGMVWFQSGQYVLSLANTRIAAQDPSCKP